MSLSFYILKIGQKYDINLRFFTFNLFNTNVGKLKLLLFLTFNNTFIELQFWLNY